MERQTRVGLIALVLMVALACAPMLPSIAPLPTRPAGAVGTMVIATHAAAATQTARNLPSPTITSATRAPSKTPTSVLPTATFTFPTFTPYRVPTSTKFGGGDASEGGSGAKGGGTGGGGRGGGGGGSEVVGGGTGGHYFCKLQSVTPADGSHISPRDSFTVIWKVKNLGRYWDPASVDYAYVSGTVMFGKRLYDLPGIPHNEPDYVYYGEIVELPVEMVAPANSGTYTTVWGMKLGTSVFCTMSLTIVVP